MKSGTSTFFKLLCQHPRIRPPVQKAVRYFSSFPNQSPAWYRSFFPVTEQGELTGEATPVYFWAPDAPEMIKRLIPDVRLIVLFRNPVDRAFSQFNMQQRVDVKMSFEEAIDVNNPEGLERKRHYLEHGHYARYVKRWLEVFPREQMLFIRFETFFANPRAGLDAVFHFLGIESCIPEDLEAREVGVYTSTLSPETRTKLVEYYRQPNRELQRLLGEEFTWDD
jgi:hypothetical protein